MILHQGKRYNQVRVLNPTPLDVNINRTTVVNDTLTDVNLTLVDQNGDDVPFTQAGTELKVDTEWVRPSDWLPIPNIATSEQVFYGLCMVHQDRANLVSLRFTGDYTVDWGDGVIENFASNVVAHHQYSWASVGNVTSEGFRQALIKVTPQIGHNLTSINLQFKHPLMGSGTLRSGIFIDMVMNLPQLASGGSIILGGGVTTIILHSFTERVNIMSIGSATSLQGLCLNFLKLQKFEIGDTVGVISTATMFQGCYSLRVVPLFNTANVTSMQNMFVNCYNLESIPLFNTANVTIMQNMFQNCYTLQTVPLFNTDNVTNMQSMFLNCFNLKTVSLFNTVNVTNMQNMFLNCYSLQFIPIFNTISVQNMVSIFQSCLILKSVNLNLSAINTALTSAFNSTASIEFLILNGCRYGFNISNNELSATALNDLFTSLGIANGSQTITITGNPGAATCNTSIATAKGFTVVI